MSMTEIEEKQRIVDVRLMPPPARHPYIFKVFDELEPDETLLVVVDHDPAHLVQFMKHERRDFDSSTYKSYQKSPGEWIGIFRKKTPEEAPSKILFTSFEKEKSFNASSFSPVPVYTSKDYKVILAYFKAGAIHTGAYAGHRSCFARPLWQGRDRCRRAEVFGETRRHCGHTTR